MSFSVRWPRRGRALASGAALASLLLAHATLAGCTDEGRGFNQTGQTGDGLGDGDGDGDGDLDIDGGEDDGGDIGKLDSMADGGNEGGDDGLNATGCTAVDFLFVIDNSGSMSDEQSALISSFPAFIDAIDSTLDVDQDYHLMVTDVDAWPFTSCVDPILGPLICPLDCGPLVCDDPNTMGVDESATPLECENVLGAGVTYPRGNQSSLTDCNFASGKRYIDKSEPDVKAAFECAARVGTTSGETERPMEAMVNAVAPSGAVASCNDGFLRDDAILVVTFITDEDDNAGDSAGTPEGWKAALAAAKNNDPNAVVVLGIFGQGSGCAESSARLTQFVDLFGDKGFKGEICSGNYQQVFLDAVQTIGTTCDEFVPPAG